MRTITVPAKIVLDKDTGEKFDCGAFELQQPENIEEARKLYGTDEKFLAYAFASYKIRKQHVKRQTSGLKKQARLTASKVDKAIALATAEGDEDTLKALRKAGLLTD